LRWNTPWPESRLITDSSKVNSGDAAASTLGEMPWASASYDPFRMGECTKPEILVAVAEECLRVGASEVTIGDGSQMPRFDWSLATTLDRSTNLAREADRLSARYGRTVRLACLDVDTAAWLEVPTAISLGRVAISIEGDGSRVSGRLAFDLGPAAASVTAGLLPVPEGFAAAAAQAPLAAQWNLDLLVVRAWLQPCLHAIDEDLGRLDRFGVRSGRAVLQAFDPDDKSGAGAVVLDLAHQKFFASQLDELPMRSTLERRRTFGPHAGHSISIPFVATLDYVLTDKLAMAAVGDGLLAKVVGSGKTEPGPVASIDILPPAMSAEAWRTLLGALDRRDADVIVERLLRWREGHIAVTIEGTSLLVAATGVRR